MFVRAARGEPLRVLEPTSVPIGILPDLNSDGAQTIHLHPGGALFVISDGVFESRSPGGELFDPARVIDVLDRCADATPDATLACLRQAVLDWQAREEPADDQSVVIAQIAL
jgi:serine phosphatase RsbU (regulator of sigma subunit)